MTSNQPTAILMSGDDDLPSSYRLRCDCCSDSIRYDATLLDTAGVELDGVDTSSIRYSPNAEDVTDLLAANPTAHEVRITDDRLLWSVVAVWERETPISK